MSKAFSSRKPSSLLPPKEAIATSCAKKRQSPRSPLQDLNRISSSSNSSYASSNVSAEAPRGCLRFLSSSFKTPAPTAHRPKTFSKTPNSVPNAVSLRQIKSKPPKENPSKGKVELKTKRTVSDKAQTGQKNPPCLYRRQPGKKFGSRTGQKSRPCSALIEHGNFLSMLPPDSEELKKKEGSLQGRNGSGGEHLKLNSCHSDANLTPLRKGVARLGLDNTDVVETLNASISITPPIHNSVSPEIQCGSSLVSTTTPACYGAGYVVSGVADKRKCRPRGILTIEETYSGLGSCDHDDDQKKIINDNDGVSPSLLPLPSEAIVQWLSSPCKKGTKDLSPKSDSRVNQIQGLSGSTTFGSSTSPSCSSKSFWNVSDSSDLSSAAYHIRRRTSSSNFPSGPSGFQVPFDSMLSPSYPSLLFSSNSTPSCKAGNSEKEKGYQYNLIDENSPFSMNSLGSGNVIQTPQSDSSSDLYVGLSLVHKDNREKDSSTCDSVDVFLSENFPLGSFGPLDNSVNSSFQFDCPTVPYESIDLSKLSKFSDDRDPSHSSSAIENASQSQMRISCREGLVSQPYVLDEFDYCRCLSDEDDLADDCSNHRSSASQDNAEVDGDKKSNSDIGITETEDHEAENDQPKKENFPNLTSYSG